MRIRKGGFWILALLFGIVATPARADVCVSIDEAHDTLAPSDRAAAVLLLEQQFESTGQHVDHAGCTEPYLVSHIKLGTTILVTLVGPHARREGRAIGLDDLPALYNQMVRSIVSGEPMGMAVTDRANVTSAQDEAPKRVQSDGFWYARLGYGAIFGDRAYQAPSIGFGYRGEFDRIGIDVSFLNYSWGTSAGSNPYYGPSAGSFSNSLLRLQGLYFTNPRTNRTPYLGAGLSWGQVALHHDATSWDGNGLQGELTAGYEIGRATSVKFFVQADAVLPLYQTTSLTYTYAYQTSPAGYTIPTVTTSSRYTPSLVVSFGIGGRRARR